MSQRKAQHPYQCIYTDFLGPISFTSFGYKQYIQEYSSNTDANIAPTVNTNKPASNTKSINDNKVLTINESNT